MGGSKSKDGTKEGSKDKNKNTSKNSDGLMGERRIRTFLIGGVLIAFCILALPFLIDRADLARQTTTGPACDLLKLLGQKCNREIYIAYACIAAGAALILIFAALAAILHCVSCDGGIETIVGYLLLLGGIVYLIGYIILTIKAADLGWTGAAFFVFLGEGLLCSVTALFLGLDVVNDFMATEERRLFYNLLNLATVSGLCLVGYSDYAQNALSDSAPELIASGYGILLVCSIIYCVLNFCGCITCNCDNNCLVRLLLAGGLIVGGLFCAIGYYVYVGDIGEFNQGNFWSYYVGYTILIGGLCIIWALDMGIVDTVKQGTRK